MLRTITHAHPARKHFEVTFPPSDWTGGPSLARLVVNPSGPASRTSGRRGARLVPRPFHQVLECLRERVIQRPEGAIGEQVRLDLVLEVEAGDRRQESQGGDRRLARVRV